MCLPDRHPCEPAPEEERLRVSSPVTTPPPTAVRPPRPGDAPPPGTVIPSHYARCFGCGEKVPNGLHLQTVAGEGLTTVTELKVSDGHQGAPGLIHGGLLAAVFDEAVGSLMNIVRQLSVTARLEVDYVQPVPTGSLLHVVAECVGVDGRKIYAQATARSGGARGPEVARASALFIAVEPAHFQRHGRPDPEPDAPPVDSSYNP